ncbi:BCL5p [Cordyceps javanica]|uniref:BCL5p n=1 Tax=Cordyceps javanica TaxID=43265 RepID=A0A545UP79_9HYPO|nr:BCL5p [Cordyceps javanica]TQW02966.1 BCL5p [Cordyceps javanica]
MAAPHDHESATDDVYPMHLQDVNFRKVIMACTMRFDHVLDAEKLHADLARLFEIGDWRKLGGRIRHNKERVLEIHVPKQFSAQRPPLTFSCVDLSSTPIAKHSLASKLPVPTEQTSVQPNPYSLIELGIRKGIPGTIDDMVDRDLPQVSLHIVRFRDATLVSISWPHCVMGSSGFRILLHAWSLVVQGEEARVPPLLGAREDVLEQLEGRDDVPADERWIPQERRLAGWGLVSFFFRQAWRMVWNPRPEVRTVFLPKLALRKLLDACREETSDGACEDEKGSSWQESMLMAWFIRLSASASPPDRPVTIVNFLSAGQCLASMFDQAGAYVQNMVGYSFSFLSDPVARGGLGPLLREHDQSVKQQSTEAQFINFLRTYRRATRNGGTFRLFYGPPDAHIIACNSFVEADLMGAVDFGKAALPDADADIGASSGTAPDRAPAGTMTTLYYHIINNRLGVGLDCVYLLGKDHAENLWVTAALPAKVWDELSNTLEGMART